MTAAAIAPATFGRPNRVPTVALGAALLGAGMAKVGSWLRNPTYRLHPVWAIWLGRSMVVGRT